MERLEILDSAIWATAAILVGVVAGLTQKILRNTSAQQIKVGLGYLLGSTMFIGGVTGLAVGAGGLPSSSQQCTAQAPDNYNFHGLYEKALECKNAEVAREVFKEVKTTYQQHWQDDFDQRKQEAEAFSEAKILPYRVILGASIPIGILGALMLLIPVLRHF